MLLSFRVQNFRSIRDEQELSLMRSRRIAAHQGSEGFGISRVSPVAGIYGSNASGKSNLLYALNFMIVAVTESHSRWTQDRVPVDPFRLDDEHPELPSRFEVELSLDGIRYQYGFECDRQAVVREWLYAYPHGRRQTWFERDRDGEEEWYFGKALTGRNRVIRDVTRSNALFLSVAAMMGHDQLSELYHWFEAHCYFVNPDNFMPRLLFTIEQLERKEHLLAGIKKMLRFADLGISDVEVRHRDFPPEQREQLIRLASALAGKGIDESSHSEDDLAQMMHRAGATLELQHMSKGKSETVGLPFEAESNGTRTIIALAGPVLDALEHGSTLLLDEIDTSLHLRLVGELVHLFQSPETNPRNAQLIFSSHDTSLLGSSVDDEPVLERDQIWFVEKDDSGASFAYPLTDFSPRKHENWERGYRQGRYGGIPVVGPREVMSCGSVTEGR